MAVEGIVASPMKKYETASPSFVSWPGPGTQEASGPGKVTFSFAATSWSWVKFSFEVLSPGWKHNSFYLQVDDSSPYKWAVVPLAKDEFKWRTPLKWWKLAPGRHVLHVIAREHGTKLSKVKIHQGEAHFTGIRTLPRLREHTPPCALCSILTVDLSGSLHPGTVPKPGRIPQNHLDIL